MGLPFRLTEMIPGQSPVSRAMTGIFFAAEIKEISEIVTELHNYTADIDEFSGVELAQLKQMSVELTHG